MNRASPSDRLLEILHGLPAEHARQLLEFAEFLSERHGRPTEIPEPLDIPRPQEESVVHALKRLRATYPMLDPAGLLNESYELMTQHLTQGRGRVEVIDRLEALFRRYYEQMRNNGGR